MKAKIYCLFFLLFSCGAATAQNKTVAGTVTSGTGEALSGVTITLKGTNTATTTNPAGHYTTAVVFLMKV